MVRAGSGLRSDARAGEPMITLLATAILSAVSVAIWLVRAQREISTLRASLDQRTKEFVEGELLRVWEQLGRAEAEQTFRLSEWMRRADKHVLHLANDHGRVDARLNVVEAWIGHWVQQHGEG
jgi:hypothetical protein